MQQARNELLTGQRAIVFCRSRAICERIAERLQCQLYHRTFHDKETSLATWIDGSEKIMIATSALGTGVDIGGIRLVLHLSRPHGIMDFVQEVGRAGRKGESVESVVVLGRREMQWLGCEAAKDVDWNREGVRLVLNEQTCRRARLSLIMDGVEIECGELGGQQCDLCRSAGGVETGGKTSPPKITRAEEQSKTYAVGPQLWHARVQHYALQRQVVGQAVVEIGTQCAACWVRSRANRSHRPENCPVLEDIIAGDYWTKRRSLRFAAECHCCYHCSLPGDWCPWYSQGQKCTQPDVITPIVLAGWGAAETQNMLVEEVGSSSVDDLFGWMGRASRLGGTKAPNGVRLAEAIIQRLRAVEG